MRPSRSAFKRPFLVLSLFFGLFLLASPIKNDATLFLLPFARAFCPLWSEGFFWAQGQALTSLGDAGGDVDTVICEAMNEREQVEETLDHPTPLLKTAAGGRSAGWGGFLETLSLPGLDRGRYGQVDFSWHPESDLLPCSKAAEVRWFVTTQRS